MSENIEKINLNNEIKSDKKKNNNMQRILQRNYGIDLLKILSMINIINLHINNHTNQLKLGRRNPKYKPVYRLEAFSFFPVNVFGLVSGIIGYKKCKFINIIYIWFEYFFYSVFLTMFLYYKSMSNFRNLILSFFPLGIIRHWYVNSYIFMYLFLPFITDSLNSLDKNFFTKMVLFYFFFYSIYHTIVTFYFKTKNYDYINGGYSSVWILVLYIIGGYLGRFFINKFSFCNIIFIFIYFIMSFTTSEYIFYTIDKYKSPNRMLLQYFSPTIIIQALSLIILFSNLKIRNIYLIKVISFFNPLNFNVTLIHARVFYFNIPIINKFYKFIKSMTPEYLFFKIYGSSILIYFICAFIDYFRFLLFKLFKIRNLCIFIDKKIF